MSYDKFLDSMALTFQDRVAPFVELGIPVIPLAEQSKEPVTQHAAGDASTSIEQIEAWAKQFPDANIGAVAQNNGANSSFWFLDDDAGTLHTLVELPQTMKVRTSRGFHYYFRHDEASRAARYGTSENGKFDIPGFKGEARCNNQYVVGFGSVHPSGIRYERVNDSEPIAAPAELLTWLQEAYRLSEESKGRSVKPISKIDTSKMGLHVGRPAISAEDKAAFKRLAEDVGFEPLIRRMNELSDERFQDPDLTPGAHSYCPIPPHGTEDHGGTWKQCFGPMKKKPTVLSCLVCGWTGDVIKAIYAMEGDKYPTMYDAARALCAEEGLKFEDYFAEPETKPDIKPETAYGVKPPSSVAPVDVDAAGSDDATAQGNAALSASAVKQGAALSVVGPTPHLSAAAYHGIIGRIIQKLSPETESHPAGNMLALMASLGNVMGRNPYIVVESTPHFANLFVVNVGATSRSRKGSGRNRIKSLMDMVDSPWVDNCTMSGLGSGEVLIYSIRDAVEADVEDEDGNFSRSIVDPGVEDKRRYISEGEFSKILTVCKRQDSILSIVIRDAWDSAVLRNLAKSGSSVCRKPHISINADITGPELRHDMPTVEMFNGSANRFIWIHVERQGLKPFGGEDIDWSKESLQLRKIIQFAQGQERIFMTRNARLMWERIYKDMADNEAEGVLGAIMARGEPQILRLALIFAMADMSTHIDTCHLKAAEAIWQYSVASVQHIFGMSKPVGTLGQTLEFLKLYQKPLYKTEVYDLFGRNRKMDLIEADLATLVQQGLVRVIPMEVKGRKFDAYTPK